jgi:hypothetical protein
MGVNGVTMGSPDLLQRAKEIMRGKALVKTALVIAPLAASVPVMGDSIFSAGLKSISGTSGGGVFGRVYQAFPAAGGVSLSGNTNITGLKVDGDNYQGNPTGYLSAKHAAGNGGVVDFLWRGGLSGDVATGDFLNVFHDFCVNVFRGGGSTDAYVPLSWELSAKVTYFRYDTETLDNVIYSLLSNGDGQGPSTGLTSKPFEHAGQAESWEVKLNFNWGVNGVGDAVINPNDRLAINIPTGTSIDLSIGTEQQQADAAPAPLPATVWMGGTLLGWVGVGRMRRRTGGRDLANR